MNYSRAIDCLLELEEVNLLRHASHFLLSNRMSCKKSSVLLPDEMSLLMRGVLSWLHSCADMFLNDKSTDLTQKMN